MTDNDQMNRQTLTLYRIRNDLSWIAFSAFAGVLLYLANTIHHW